MTHEKLRCLLFTAHDVLRHDQEIRDGEDIDQIDNALAIVEAFTELADHILKHDTSYKLLNP